MNPSKDFGVGPVKSMTPMPFRIATMWYALADKHEFDLNLKAQSKAINYASDGDGPNRRLEARRGSVRIAAIHRSGVIRRQGHSPEPGSKSNFTIAKALRDRQHPECPWVFVTTQ
jgi:hypothetical protein